MKACKGVLVWNSLTGNTSAGPSPPPPASSSAVFMTTPPLVSPFGGQPPPPQQQQQAQAARDVNTASLCRIGQEAVQDIVLRTMEIFQLLRNMQVCHTLVSLPTCLTDRIQSPSVASPSANGMRRVKTAIWRVSRSIQKIKWQNVIIKSQKINTK